MDMTILGYEASGLRGWRLGSAIADEDVGRLLSVAPATEIDCNGTLVVYGRSEEPIGRHVGYRREEYSLASKCGCPLPTPCPHPHDYSPPNVRASVEQDLRPLCIDRFDLVPVHRPPNRTQIEADDTTATLSTLRDDGKVRFIGVPGILPHLPGHAAVGMFNVSDLVLGRLAASTRTSSARQPVPERER